MELLLLLHWGCTRKQIKINKNPPEHNLKSLMDVADYGFILVQGELIAHDTCKNLKQSPIMKKVFVGEFD